MDSLTALVHSCRVEPRPYQARIVTQVLDAFLDQELRSVLVESPTGSGKTVMGLMIARLMQQALGLKVGWVAMRRYLLAQAEAENAERGLGLQASYISMFDRDPPAQLDLLVVDEAQHDAAASMAHLHNVVRPFRADKIKLCFDKVVRDAGIHRLISDGYLSRFDHYTLPDFQPTTIAQTYLREPKRWGRSVIYFHTVPQCEEAAHLLRAGGVRCEVVTGTSDRDAQLRAFRAGDVDVLINCLVLAEGFDDPTLQTVFCRPSGKAITVQMGGRVLRKHPDYPVKQVVQCRKTRWPFARTATPDMQYVWKDGQWAALASNPHVQAIYLRTLRAVARADVKLPVLLQRASDAAARQRRPWRDE
jgi:superfamily II DNA or RNA helicase